VYRALFQGQSAGYFQNWLASDIWRSEGAKQSGIAALRPLVDPKTTEPAATPGALWALGIAAPEEVGAAARALLTSENRDVRLATAEYAARSKEAMPDLQRLVGDGDIKVRRRAIASLLQLGDQTASDAGLKELAAADPWDDTTLNDTLTGLLNVGLLPEAALPFFERQWSSIRGSAAKCADVAGTLPPASAAKALLLPIRLKDWTSIGPAVDKLVALRLTPPEVIATLAGIITNRRDSAIGPMVERVLDGLYRLTPATGEVPAPLRAPEPIAALCDVAANEPFDRPRTTAIALLARLKVKSDRGAGRSPAGCHWGA